jgi:hypothetical protein
LSGFGVIVPPEKRWSLPFFSEFGDKTRQRNFIARALPLQADDIRAHCQQNGNAYSDNDQEEFSHCSASLGSQRKAAGIVLCWRANAPAFAEGPAIEAGPPEVEA